MQIPTNTGPITLAPSDIENGMVFRDPTDNDANTFRADPALYTDGIAGMQEVAEALAADVAAGKVYFLGCDPRLTSRAGCERFGVSSTVDAAAHGFARLRDGGAVDLRVRGNVPKGTIISHEYGSRVDFDELLGAKGAAHGANARFVGLNEDHARPEDVRRMCCGATGNGFVFGSPGREVVCTLAIGEHDTHENLATGIKWSAPAKLKLIVGVDLAQRPRSPVTQDGASRSPAGITWPFEFTNGNFTFTAGVASLPVQVSRSEEANDIFLHFVNVPSGDNLFTLRDMFTQMGRVRFTLRDLAGTEARYEATPNDVKTAPNYRLVDATNIEVRVVDVKRVETADEYWTVPKPSSARDIIPDIQRAMRVYAAPRRDASSGDMAAVKDAVARLASPEANTCAPLPTQASLKCKLMRGELSVVQSKTYNVWKNAIPSPFTISVKRHEGLVPNGCDSTRWRAVLNVIGADVTEAAQHRKRLGEPYDAERDIGNRIVRTHQTMVTFASLRFVHGYDTKEATRRACERFVGTVHYGEQERLCRVYEAG